MPIVSLSINEQILDKFNKIVARRAYSSRSEAFRDAIRDFVDAEEWSLPAGRNTLIMAILYNRDEPKTQLSLLRHKFEEIKTMLHTHIDDINCLEVLIAEGLNNRLKEIISNVRSIRGVKQIKYINTVSEVQEGTKP